MATVDEIRLLAERKALLEHRLAELKSADMASSLDERIKGKAAIIVAATALDAVDTELESVSEDATIEDLCSAAGVKAGGQQEAEEPQPGPEEPHPNLVKLMNTPSPWESSRTNGHELRRRGRTEAVLFRCTPEDRQLLVGLAKTLNMSFTDTMAHGLYALRDYVAHGPTGKPEERRNTEPDHLMVPADIVDQMRREGRLWEEQKPERGG